MKITALLCLVCFACVWGENINFTKWSQKEGSSVEKNGEIWKVEAKARHCGVDFNYDVKPEVRYAYSCELRGSGLVGVGILGSEGWTYAPNVQLSDEWTHVEKDYASSGKWHIFSVYNISNTTASFEIRNVCVQEEKELDLPTVDVPPVFLQATDYPGHNCRISEMDGAYEGKAVSGKQWYRLVELPVPLSGKPLYYYAHVFKSDDKVMNLFFSSHEQPVCKSVKYEAGKSWNWVRFPAMKASLAYPQVILSSSGNAETMLYADKFVVTTDAELSDEQLDAVQKKNAVLKVGKGTPEIDGKVDDLVWKAVPALSPFLLCNQKNFARQQSEARFCWDDTFFYASFKCRERALEPRENTLGAFKRDCNTPDSDEIYKDDAVELLLWRPETPETVYDICVNAKGTILDCVSKVSDPDLWGRRDRTWNSGCLVKTFVNSVDGDGYWSVEMAIPLEKIGGSIVGRNWKALVSRSEKAYTESSLFSYVPVGGIHIFKYLREIELAEESAGCALLSMPEFVPGSNKLVARIKSNQPMTLEAVIEANGKTQRFSRSFAVDEQANATLSFPLNVKDEFEFSWRLRSSAGMDTCMTSPKYGMSVVTSILSSKVEKGTLLVNGAAASKSVMLQQGLNMLCVKGKDAKVQLAANELEIPFPDVWQEEGGEYRLNLMNEITTVWPNWNAIGGVSVNRGGLQQLMFFPNGFKGFKLDDYTICVDVPEEMTLLGATGYYKKYPLEVGKAGKVSYDGKDYTRYEVKVKKTLEHKKLASHELLAFVFSVSEDFASDKAQIYYFARSRNSAMLELPNRLNVKILPKMAGGLWKRLHCQMCCSWLYTADDIELQRQIGYFLKKAGVTDWNVASGESTIRQYASINFQDWNFSCLEYLKANPDAAQIGKDGKASKLYVCASDMALNPKFAEFFRNGIVEWHEKRKCPQNIEYDYEYNVYEGISSCFCAQCLKHFADEYGIKDALDSHIIKEKYEKEWTVFTNRRLAQIVKVLVEAIHEKLPGVSFFMYSGYQSEMTKLKYGVDWALFDGVIDYAAAGYGRNVKELSDMYKALKSTPLITGAIVYPYDTNERSAPSYISAAELMRHLCDSTFGCLVYDLPPLDGRTFSSIAAVSSATARFEDVFANGKKRPELLVSNDLREEQYQIIEDEDGNLLFAVMNQTTAKLKCNPKIANAENYNCFNAISGEAVNGLACEVEPNDFALFQLKKKK